MSAEHQRAEVHSVPIAELLGGHVAILEAEGRRRVLGKGLPDPALGEAVLAIQKLAESFDAWLLPVAGKIAAALLDVVIARETSNADDALWQCAADCSARWPGAFSEFADGVISRSVQLLRASEVEPALLSWLASPVRLSAWTAVLLTQPTASATASFRQYAELLHRLPAVPAVSLPMLEHVEALVLLTSPTSPILNRHAITLAQRSQRDADVRLRVVGAKLRLLVGAVVHPRAAPLHVPLAAPQPTTVAHPATEGPFQADGQHTLRTAEAPRMLAPTLMPRVQTGQGLPAPKTHRSEPTSATVVDARRTQPASQHDDIELPDIVDDDLE
jgi:hypothetical protein